MTDYFYETKESTADRFRAVVVTPFEDGIGRVDFVTLDDEHHVISLEDLAFLVRAARSLPRELFEPISMYPVVQPQAVAVPASDTKVERPERAGGRWTKAEEIKMSGHFKSGMEVADIFKLMERSPASIVSRLLKLDLIVVQPKDMMS
jgi:hypothetical protein